VTINDHVPSVKVANSAHLQWTRANSNISLFRGPAASKQRKGNRKQFLEISYITRVRIHSLFKIKLIV
jgi:hypothetical protein